MSAPKEDTSSKIKKGKHHKSESTEYLNPNKQRQKSKDF